MRYHKVASFNLLLEKTIFAFYIIKIQLETLEIDKGGTDTKGGMDIEFEGHRVACPNVIINRTNFAFYSIKIRLEHWRELKGGADTMGVQKLSWGGRKCIILMYSLTGLTLLFTASKAD